MLKVKHRYYAFNDKLGLSLVNRKHKARKRGFTLVELLVVISILAVLGIIGFATYHNAQVVARDARRKQDLNLIAAALKIYYNENHDYPSDICPTYPSDSCPFPHYESVGGGTSWLPGLVPTFISVLPVDPINNGDPDDGGNNAFGYKYEYGTNYCQAGWHGLPWAAPYFKLVTGLENLKDKDINGEIPNVDCDNECVATGPYPRTGACPCRGDNTNNTHAYCVFSYGIPHR